MKRLSQLSGAWKLTGILAVFSAIVLGNITRWSIWFDEAFTAYIVRFNFAEIYHYTAQDVHPPLYYWAVKLWTVAFGASELTLRSLSLVLAVVGLIGLYKLTKKLFDEKTGLVVTALAAMTPILIRFSEEARMYMLVFAIVMWATYLLVLQTCDKPTTRRWVVYAILISAGMWVHYYAALAWLGHWVWRYVELRIKSKKDLRKRFFSKQWLGTFGLAIALYLPWLPYAVMHFATVQRGFWIPKLGVYTPIDYVSNGLIYQQYGQLLGWQAVVFIAATIATTIVVVKARKHMDSADRQGFRLFGIMALVPPLLLMVLSLPPLTPSFIDRYVISSLIFLVGLIGISLLRLYKYDRKLSRLSMGLIVAMFAIGIFNVYYYGNYNKNSSTSIRVREVSQLIDASSKVSQPIILDNGYIYYEAVFYESEKHPVYFINDTVDYEIGAVKMLEENEMNKVRDLDAFSDKHPRVWFMTSADNEETVEPPVATWTKIDSVEAYDYIDDSAKYRAILYDTNR